MWELEMPCGSCFLSLFSFLYMADMTKWHWIILWKLNCYFLWLPALQFYCIIYLQYRAGGRRGKWKTDEGYQLGPITLLMIFSGFMSVSIWERNSNGEAFLKRFISKYLMWEDNYKLIRWGKRIVLFILEKIKHIFLPSRWYIKRKHNIVC